MAKVSLEKLIKVSRKCAESENPKAFFENPKHAIKFFKNLPAIEDSASPEVVAVFLSVDALKGLKKFIKVTREYTRADVLREEFKKMKDTLDRAIIFAATYKEGETDRLEKELSPIITSAINIATTINSLHLEEDEDECFVDEAPVSGEWFNESPIGSGELNMIEGAEETASETEK